MSLPYEYFKNKTHITDLQKLRDNEIYFIIRSFYDEQTNFNKIEAFNLKGLINLCNKTKEIFKNIRYILTCYMDVCYMDVINENKYPYCSKSDIDRLLSDMDKIELVIKNIMAVRQLKNRVNALVDSCLLNIRVLYNSLSEFIFLENHIWEA